MTIMTHTASGEGRAAPIDQILRLPCADDRTMKWISAKLKTLNF